MRAFDAGQPKLRVETDQEHARMMKWLSMNETRELPSGQCLLLKEDINQQTGPHLLAKRSILDRYIEIALEEKEKRAAKAEGTELAKAGIFMERGQVLCGWRKRRIGEGPAR